MKNAALGALVLLTVACGAYRFPGGESGTGTVSGTLTIPPCAPEPDAGICAKISPSNVEIDFTAGHSVFSTVTDTTGRYTIDLRAATYRVSVKPPLQIIGGPTPLVVKAGSNLVANYQLGWGIRVPVPQQ